MKIGAVIVAAGKSSRMGDFKPLLRIGSISIVRRIIVTFQQSGVNTIVLVTGHRADELEHHVIRTGAICIRNNNYASTHMFDSACIGLSYLKGKCDRILFTPVDVPLFTVRTVTRLLESNARIAVPICEGKQGHPILLSSDIIEDIISLPGEGGLREIVSSYEKELDRIKVPDGGTLLDVDTPKDYHDLLEYHNRQILRPLTKVSLAREKPFFGDGTATLLHLIEYTGSVRMACQQMNLSYSKAWRMINSLEDQLGYSVIVRRPGGIGGGGSSLTLEGKELLDCYERFKEDCKATVDKIFEKHFKDFF